MKIPNELKIGGHIIKVDMSQKLDGANGKFEYDENTIYICKTLPQSQKESTLIHEIMHGLNSTFMDRDLGHLLLDSLSEQLYQVLKDNNLLK